ncbi:MAG: GNAT family N-acetyltransferase, partial [Spirochaetaceae bacterium]|nr:GNAT family N-acetyltransferase [Spirochaetaceae bacterium]
GDPALTFSSFGLYCNGRLVAGDFGSITGRIYTSYSGYYDENNAGTVQMIHTAHYLRDNGYAFWNLGMPLSYKSRLGAPTLSLEKFIPLWRKHVCQTPLPTLDYERMPAEYR